MRKLISIALMLLPLSNARAQTPLVLLEAAGPRLELIYQRLTGAPLTPRRPDYAKWKALLDTADRAGLARLAAEEPGFLNVKTLHWATVYYSAGKSAAMPLDDALATLIGTVRDNRDARELLSGDYMYGPDPRLATPPSVKNNTGFELIERRRLSMQIALHRESPQWGVLDMPETAGLLTTRSWALANYNMGTNRRAIKAAFETFLCRSNETWRVGNMPVTHIRRDVDRAPGGDARVFHTDCRTCHSVLDGLSGAMSQLEYDANRGFFQQAGTLAKYAQHADVYPPGYVTQDRTWINELGESHDPVARSFGWRGPTRGEGVRELGSMLAASEAFSACLAKRVFSTVCLQDKELSDPVIQNLAQEFETQDQYKLKDLFIRAVLRPECFQ